jgi:two-component system chemotaxis response regulator CheB
MTKTRILVAEDSTTVRKRLVEVLAGDPEVEIVGEAEDGKRAIELCRECRPHLITMDMMMPVMSGLAATEYIMAHMPTPILVVSASINRGELFKIYDALAAGAVDVLEKPNGHEPEDGWEQRLRKTAKLVAKIRVITHPRARLERLRRPSLSAPASVPTICGSSHPARSRGGFAVLAIGASTGGPAAIVEILRALPPAFEIPILVVQHINEPFGTAFAEWLGVQIGRRSLKVEDDMPVSSAHGRVVVAPAGRHLLVRDGRIRLTSDPERHSCRPAIDVLFESVATEYGGSAAACLLTGMGRDGALGLRRIREAGGLTIAQDEATSVVYGMPREAALLGAAAHVLGIGEIAPRLAWLQRTAMLRIATGVPL